MEKIYIILFCAVMSIVMACAVAFDGTNSRENGGLFLFRHQWVNNLCRPMLLLIPVLLLWFVATVPLDVTSVIGNIICRSSLFVLISMGLETLFSGVILLCLMLNIGRYASHEKISLT